MQVDTNANAQSVEVGVALNQTLSAISTLPPHDAAFWNFGIDEYALYDIPDSIEYILDATGESSVSYVGFSQGTAQAFAALSIHPKLNQKINVFVALAPAMSPPGLSAPLVDGMMKSS